MLTQFRRCFHAKRIPSYQGYWDRILDNALNKIHTTKKPITVPIAVQTTIDTQPVIKQCVMFKGTMIELPDKPSEPDNCCMSGCVHCVWDLYQEEMEDYSDRKNKIREQFRAAGEPLPSELSSNKENSSEGMDPALKAFMEMEKKLNR